MNLPCQSCGTSNSNERQFCGQCGHSMLAKCEQCQFCNSPGDKFCGGCGLMVASAEVPVNPSSVQFPRLPEIHGVDAPEPDDVVLGLAGLSESGAALGFGLGGDATLQSADDPVDNVDIIQKYSAATAAKLPEIPSKHMTLIRADLKLAAGQSEGEEEPGLEAVLQSFADFSQYTVEHSGGQQLARAPAYLLWGFDDPDPVVAAQRAAAASLELMTSLELFNFQQGQDYQLHIGLTTGQVQLDKNSSPTRVSGRVLELLSRVVNLTPGDSVYLCQNTVDCLDGAHHAELVGQVQEPDTQTSVALHQLLIDQALESGAAPEQRPLIGRDTDMCKLRAGLQLALEEERGRWLMVTGAPGIGKSRLLEELHHEAPDLRAESFLLAVGNDSHAPRQCLLQTLAQQLVALRHPGLALEQAHQRLTEELLLSEEETSQLAEMLGMETVNPEAAIRADSQCNLIVRLLNHRRVSPGMLLIIEDMHWASDSLQQRIALLCDRLRDMPVLVVFTSRDCYEKTAFSLQSDMRGESFALPGLSSAAAFELAATYLPVRTPIVRQSVSRATGNPLFLTQQLQAAIDTINSQAPGSLRGIVNAKMGLLETRAREQLQAAAVLGSRFSLGAWSGLLGELPESCDALVAAQLLSTDVAGYRFSHELVHSVVYRSIDKARVREIHLSAAQYYEQHAEISAWHYLKAGEPLSGISQVLEAGTLALGRGELARAAELLDALAGVDESQLATAQRYRLHRLRADCHTRRSAHQQALSSYEQAMSVAGTGFEQTQTKLLMAGCYGELDNTAAALQMLGEVLAESRLNELGALETQALQLRANILFQSGRYSDAESDLRAGLSEVRSLGDVQTQIDISQALGELLCRQGQIREAEQLISEAHQQRDRCRHGEGWADRDPWLGQCLYFLGDACGARDILQAAVEHAKSIGDETALLQARCLLGPVLLDLGEPASALANGKLAMSISAGEKQDGLASMAMVAVGESHVRLGKYALGLQMLTQAWTRSEPGDAKYSTGPWALAALATVVQRDVEQRNLLAKAEHLLHSGAEGLSHFWFYRLAIQVALGGSDERLARRYAQLLSKFESGQELPWVKQACAGLVEPSTAQVLVAPLN